MSSSAPTGTPSAPPVRGAGLTIYGCRPDEAALFRATAPRAGLHPTITAAAVSAEGAALAAGHRCVSVDHRHRVGADVLRALSEVGVRYLGTRSVGRDHVDLECAAALGIRVGTATYAPDGVADYAVMLLLMAVRDAGAVLARVAAHDYRVEGPRGRELRDLTVGVVGTGRIGSAVVARLRGFGARVLTHDEVPAPDHVPLDELLERSDAVTLHTPLTARTRHLLDRGRLARMKPGAVVVNTARGALVDTAALVAALEEGRLGGAALDVVEGEEGVFSQDRRDRLVDDPLLRRLHALPNVVLSPHAAYYTDRALRETVASTLAGCAAFESGARRG
jgi:D-specific alpha-keto acid dehydrogenase